ncbi:MAG: DNA polymerase III subunit delta' [Bacillota bacterium]
MFKAIIGNGEVIKQLKEAIIRGRVHHAYLFHGPDGVGKRTAAVALAAALNCQDPQAGDSCGKCPVCLQIKKGVHPNLHWLSPDEQRANRSIRIEQIRDLQEKLSYKRWQGNYTVVIIDEGDLMTQAAGNSLLKVLEEPAPGTCFVLLTARPESLLPTILSRCQKLRFTPVKTEEILALLLKKGTSPAEGEQIAHLSNGSPGKALALLQDEKILAERAKALSLCRSLAQGGVKEALETSETIWKTGSEALLEWMGFWWRDLLVWQLAGKEKLLVNLDLIKEIQTEYFEPEALRQALMELERARFRLDKNANRRLCFDVMALKINQGFRGEKEEANHG